MYTMVPNNDRIPMRALVDWGDDDAGWTEYCNSGEEITLKHTWKEEGAYIITAKAQDIHGLNSSEVTLTVTIPKFKTINKPLYLLFFKCFTLLERLLSLLIAR